jgi:hypothetical protein
MSYRDAASATKAPTATRPSPPPILTINHRATSALAALSKVYATGLDIHMSWGCSAL